MARGIYVVTGQINLNGANGNNGTWNSGDGFSGGGGGGGGGSFVGLAEKDVNGLTNMSILASRINVSGGNAGTGYVSANRSGTYVNTVSTFLSQIVNFSIAITLNSTTPATAGGSGAIITQVIG